MSLVLLLLFFVKGTQGDILTNNNDRITKCISNNMSYNNMSNKISHHLISKFSNSSVAL